MALPTNGVVAVARSTRLPGDALLTLMSLAILTVVLHATVLVMKKIAGELAGTNRGLYRLQAQLGPQVVDDLPGTDNAGGGDQACGLPFYGSDAPFLPSTAFEYLSPHQTNSPSYF